MESINSVIERFNKIKDHQTKATKKLSELGDILAVAYKLDPATASKMWQYLVDLNVKSNEENAKFYLAQVFYKLTNKLAPEEATDLLAMVPERVELMVLHGYDGNTMWRCCSTLIQGFLKLGSIDDCMVVIDLYYEKTRRLDAESATLISVVAKSIEYANQLCAEEAQYRSAVANLIQQLQKTGDECTNAYARIQGVILGYETADDPNALISLAQEYKFASEFIELLWTYREYLSTEHFADIWSEYLAELNDEYYHIPMPSFKEENSRLHEFRFSDTPYYEGTKMQFFVNIMKGNDSILPYYFNEASSLVDYIIYSWILEGDWTRFSRYVAQLIINAREQNYEFSRVKRILDCYLNAYFYEDYHSSTDEYGRSNKIITKANVKSVEHALATISAMTIGCALHDDFHEEIKIFMLKASGNLDALNNIGFEEKADERTPEQRFRDYVHEFMLGGVRMHDNRDSEYRRICNAVKDEDNEQRKQDYSVDYSEIRAYQRALDNELAEFYFLCCNNESYIKAQMLSGCIKNDNISRALELVEMIIKTTQYEDYHERNSWAFEIKRVAQLLASSFTRDERYSWVCENVTDAQINVAYQIIEKLLPYLEADDVEAVQSKLVKMLPERSNNELYIADLLRDVDAYTTFPRPRGKGNAMNINHMSMKITESFENLARLGRLDVVSQMLTKFASVKDILYPVAYPTWMHAVVRGLTNEDFHSVYLMNKYAFEAWAESRLQDYDVIRVAEKLGTVCTREEFVDFRNMVISRRGMIDGLNSCFVNTSENSETQLLFDGNTITIKLDYVEASSSSVHIHFLTTAKQDEAKSVRAVKFEINGIPVDANGSWSAFDDKGPAVGFYIYDDEEEDNVISVYSDVLKKHAITNIDSINIQLFVYDKNADAIEKTKENRIKYNFDSGMYIVE